FDDNDWGGQDSTKLLEAAQHSALFLAMVLPAYIPPEKFTRKELDAFWNAHQARRSDVLPLVFPVEYLPIEDKDRPAQLETFRRYQFWKTEGDVAVPLTLGRHSTEIDLSQQGWRRELYALAGHIKERLNELESRVDAAPTSPSSSGPITRFLGK